MKHEDYDDAEFEDEDDFEDDGYDDRTQFAYDDEAEEEDEVEYYAVRPNKTRIKKEIAAIFAMAEEISALAPAHIAEFELPENIEKALCDAGKMGRNAAKKRLLKYITGQMRELDVDAIREKLARLKNRSAHGVREHHQAERWRDQLLGEAGNAALTQLVSEFPEADTQHLRQLQRNALKEAKEAKPPKSARLLYKYLKQLISDTGHSAATEDAEPEHDLD
ncbi:ribosome biogenesis factor YjgA [Methylomonas koyamae]|uniref:ribosome biogenesis factor YjgA n=1 Tax=Methylomonas koyamae TaxID=702114 RepID=UPI0028733B02|nr:ribosome biogenesis factor YjgA [Methylomonas koyamae]WNB75822.1 ribosome biogenesis factor YjgA [Methylomonas koyamae]